MIDASVLVKWYIQEADSDKAFVLRDKHVNGEIQLSAPALISYETMNALRYSNLFSREQLKDIALSILNYDLNLYGFNEKIAEFTLEASLKNDITVYDGSYLALAKNLGVEFFTADQKLMGRLIGEYAKIARRL